MTVRLREATPADIDTLAALSAEAMSEPWSAEGFENAIASPHEKVFVAERAEAILAYAAITVAADEAELPQIAVSETARGCGIGRQLLDYVCDRVRESGAARIFLEVRGSNTAAVRLYESGGFVRAGVRKGFYRDPDEDAYIYRKDLVE